MLLFLSGSEDLIKVIQRGWVFWVGVIVGASLLYYFESYTSSSVLTKIAMPLLAVAGGLLPHVIRRLRLAFSTISLLAGLAGLVVLYFTGTTFFVPSRSFATKTIGFLVLAFVISAIGTGILAAISLRDSWIRRASL
jgi:hypothetical protein